MATYKVLVGIDYGDKRSEIGDMVTDADLPATSIKWLTDQNVIELVEGNTTSKKKPAPASVVELESGE